MTKLLLENGGSLLLEGGGAVLLEAGISLLPWPDDITTGTNYYLANAPLGNDANSGTSKNAPWETPARANAFSGYGSGDVALNLHTGDTFSGDFAPPAGVNTWTLQGRPHPVPPKLVNLGSSIAAVGAGSGGSLPTILNSINTTGGPPSNIKGVKVEADNWYGIWCGDYNEVSYCEVSGSGSHDILTNPSRYVNVHHNTIGGVSPTSADSSGILFNYGSAFVTAYNNEIMFIGGTNPDVVWTGYGIHAAGIFDLVAGTSPIPFTYTNGVPNNALCDIRFNYIHDTGGNLSPNGASAVETQGDRIVVQDNFLSYQRSASGPSPGNDFDGGDADLNSTNVLWQRNFIAGCDGAGLLSVVGGQWGGVKYRYNVVVNCGQSTFANVALAGFGNANSQSWYNNTLVQTIHIREDYSSNGIFFYGMDNADGFFENNIVATLAGGIWAFLGVGSLPLSFVVGHNDWYGAGLGYNCYSMTGTTYGSLAEIVAAVANFDVGGKSIDTDPQFVGAAGSMNAADYMLGPASPCRGAGLDVFAAFGEDPGDYDFGGRSVRRGAVSGGPPIPAHMGAFAYD